MGFDNLEIPPEPEDVDKKWFKDSKEGVIEETEKSINEIPREKKKDILKQGTALASYFWTDSDWGIELRDRGTSFAEFISICSKKYLPFLKWWEGEKEWEEAVQELIEALESEIMELTKELIEKKAKEYPGKDWDQERKEAFLNNEKEHLETLPTRFEEGNWTIEDLAWILYWKSPNNYFVRNPKEKVETIIQEVKETDDVKEKIEKLKELDGVKVSTASAILTFMDPNKFTVIDKHSIRGLKEMKENNFEKIPEDSDDLTAKHYEIYLEICRDMVKNELSDTDDHPLRTLDRSLWIKGKKSENSQDE